MAKHKPAEPEETRVIQADGTCDPSCCYYSICKWFRNRVGRCPKWAQDTPMKEDTEELETVECALR